MQKAKTIIIGGFAVLVLITVGSFALMWNLLDEYRAVSENYEMFKSTEQKLTILAAAAATLMLTIGFFISKRVVEIEKQLINEREIAVSDSELDKLTNLYNRRGFEPLVEATIDDSRLHANVLMSLDLDNFKEINDTAGHAAGDFVLTEVSRMFKACVRETDVVARYGGDEFSIMLNNCSLEVGKQLANDIIRKVSNFTFKFSDRTFKVGVSIGLVSMPQCLSEIEDMYRAVDMALYEAKRNGRNRVEVASIKEEILAHNSKVTCNNT